MRPTITEEISAVTAETKSTALVDVKVAAHFKGSLYPVGRCKSNSGLIIMPLAFSNQLSALFILYQLFLVNWFCGICFIVRYTSFHF